MSYSLIRSLTDSLTMHKYYNIIIVQPGTHRQVVGLSEYGQQDHDLWCPQQLSTKSQEVFSRPHGCWLCLPGGLLSWRKVPHYIAHTQHTNTARAHTHIHTHGVQCILVTDTQRTQWSCSGACVDVRWAYRCFSIPVGEWVWLCRVCVVPGTGVFAML